MQIRDILIDMSSDPRTPFKFLHTPLSSNDLDNKRSVCIVAIPCVFDKILLAKVFCDLLWMNAHGERVQFATSLESLQQRSASALVGIFCLKMRSVSFVQHLKLDIKGKVSHPCMVLGDVDGDGSNELVVADSRGCVSVFKGNSLRPWQEINSLGDISCIAVGDVLNKDSNLIIVFTTDGCCSVIDFRRSASEKTGEPQVKTEQLFANVSSVLIGDVDRDGKQELVSCHSDQHVSAFRWNENVKKFILLQRWKLDHLTGNVTLHYGSDNGCPTIMVSQPGCSYSVLLIGWTNAGSDVSIDQSTEEKFVRHTPLSSRSRLQNPDISCQVLGDIKKSCESETGYFAMCTLDGTIKLMEEDNYLWSLQVDHQLFALEKMDVLGDQREEVIVCARDGQTYIVDHDRNVVRYHFPDNVQAFCAGMYSIDGVSNYPCMVYADFHKQLFLYYDVRLPFLTAPDLLSLANKDEEMVMLFNKLGAKSEDEKRKLLRKCVYQSQEKREASVIELDVSADDKRNTDEGRA